VAEFLLGNVPLKMLGALGRSRPCMGAERLSSRSSASRGLGCHSILVLGAAYILIEEGFSTRSLFNPDYLKLQLHLLHHEYFGFDRAGGGIVSRRDAEAVAGEAG